MRRIKKILIIFICVGVALCNIKQIKAEPYTMSDAKYGVVRIFVQVNSEEGYMGTGFAVGNVGEDARYFITNNHVINGHEDSVYVVFDSIDGTTIKASVIYTTEAPDIAILDIGTPTSLRKSLLLMPSEFVEVAEDVYAYGFPGSADDINDDYSNLPSTIEDITITKGIISKLSFNSGGTACFQTDTEVNPGNSGGPLVTQDGYVIGINTFGSTTGSAINGSIHIDYVIDALKNAAIPFTSVTERAKDIEPTIAPTVAPTIEPTTEPTIKPTTEPTKEPSKASLEDSNKGGLDLFYVFILIGLSVFVMAIIMIFLAVKSNKKKTLQMINQGRPQPGVLNPRPMQQLNNLPYIAPLQPNVAPIQKASMPSVQQVALVAMGGIFEGNTFSLTGPVAIGRDPKRCKIVYPSDEEGVSGLHCEIKIEAGHMILMDMGSTFGTFMKNGTKLIPYKAYSIQLGDAFYLAVAKNEYQLITK